MAAVKVARSDRAVTVSNFSERVDFPWIKRRPGETLPTRYVVADLTAPSRLHPTAAFLLSSIAVPPPATNCHTTSGIEPSRCLPLVSSAGSSGQRWFLRAERNLRQHPEAHSTVESRFEKARD